MRVVPYSAISFNRFQYASQLTVIVDDAISLFGLYFSFYVS